MADFLQALRMNGVFGGNQPTGTPFGMPNLSQGNINPQLIRMLINQTYPIIAGEKQKDRDLQMNLLKQQQSGRLDEIAQQMQMKQGAEANQPMDFRYIPSMSGYQQGTLGFKEKELEQRSEIAGQKIALGKEQLAEKTEYGKNKQALDTWKAQNPGLKPLAPKGGNFQLLDPISGKVTDSGVSTGTSTDQERQDFERGQTEVKQAGAEKLQGIKGEQNLAGIVANIAGRKEIQAEAPVKLLLPAQTRVQQINTANQLKQTRPDLADFIDFDPNTGSPVITPSGNALIDSEIQNKIFGPSGNLPTDIELSAEKKKGTKPTVPAKKLNDPLGIR